MRERHPTQLLQRSHGRSDRAASRAPIQEMTDEQKAIVEMVRELRRQGDHPQRRGVRPRGQVPGADRRADEGARPVRGDDPRGVRRHGPRPDHLRDDRRGALARLDLDLGRRQHPLHRLLPADEVRHRRAEAVLPAEDGDRRDPRRLLALGARGGLRRAGDQGHGDQGRRWQLGARGPEDVGHQRPRLGRRLRADEERPEGRPALQGDDLLHHREGALGGEERGRVRGPRDPAEDQEDGLQGRRVHRARLLGLQVPARAHPRRRGGRARQGLLADDGRARGRPRQRRRPRRRHRPARPRAGSAVLPGAQDLRQADRPAPGDPVQARRHGDQDRGRPPASPARRPG